MATLLRPTLQRFPHSPRTIVCIGRNYADHIAELNNARPKEPFFFLKPPGSLLYPPSAQPAADPDVGEANGKLLLPKGDCEVHYEVELAVVLGKKVDEWRGGRDELRDVVGGYAVAIDMTSRTYQSAAKSSRLPWSLAKGLKTFLPLSHYIPSPRIPDPHNVHLHLSINGQPKQSDSTNLMLFDIPRLLRHVSSVMPLYPGDLLLTGTPKGVGRVSAGDRITAGVSVGGCELEEGRIEVEVVQREGGYGSEEARE